MAKNNKQDGGSAVLDKFMEKAEKLPVDNKKVRKPEKNNEVQQLEENLVAEKKITRKRSKMTKAKATALNLIRKYPDAPILEIGKKLYELKLINKPEQVYNLTRADRDNGYISGERSKAKDKNWEIIDTEILPESLKIHKRVLRNKQIADLKKKDWVFQAEKVGFGVDDRRPVIPQTMKIEMLQILQNINLTECESRLKMLEDKEGLIDVTPSQDKE